jgi:carboxylesterase
MTVMPGAEAFSLPGDSGLGCLLIHGFTGSPSETRSVAEALHAVGIGSLAPRLPGHGTSPQDLNYYSRRSWLAAAENALKELLDQHDQVVMCGVSLGGTIALNLAARLRPARLSGLVTIGAPVRMLDVHYRPSEIIDLLRRWRDWDEPDIRDRSQWSQHIGYRNAPFRASLQMIRLVKETYALIPAIRVPLLVIQSKRDHTVLPQNARWLLERAVSAHRQVLWLEDSYHVATLDFDAQRVGAATAAFCQQVTIAR